VVLHRKSDAAFRLPGAAPRVTFLLPEHEDFFPANPIMPVPNQTQSGPALVRWILVVTLGCSLGLLLVYAVINSRFYPARPRGLQIVRRMAEVTPAAEQRYNVSEETVEKELRTVIESQLSAFRQDDYPEAYKFAASAMRSQVPLPAFERMVRRAYPEIAQSESAHFGMMLDNGRFALVNVTITGATGRSLHYEYALQREHYGWKIAGVSEVKKTGEML
jgi:hypothetical protein